MIVMDLPPRTPRAKYKHDWGRYLPCGTCKVDIGQPCKDFRGRPRKDGSAPRVTRLMTYPHPGRKRWERRKRRS